MHFEGDNCLKGVLMVFEWLARAKLKVIYIPYGEDISAGFGPFA